MARQEHLGTMETQPSTENASNKPGEKEIPLAFKRYYWSSCFSAEGGRKQSFPCWPPVRSAFQQQLVCSHIAHPFSQDSLWPLPWAPCSGVKGVGVYEHRARWHFRLSAVSCRGSSLQHKTGWKRTRALGKPGSDWSWGLRGWVKEEKQLTGVPWQGKDLMFWEGPRVLIGT